MRIVGKETDVDSDYIENLIAGEFPDDAYIRTWQEDPNPIALRISWPLGDDPERPNKHSKNIRLTISEEATRTYDSVGEARQEDADERILEHVRARLAQFDPDNPNPQSAVPPEEVWLITEEILGLS